MSVCRARQSFGIRLLDIIAMSAVAWMAAGCGRQSIEGTVTLDDQAMEKGYINFRPMAEGKGQPVGAPIENGKYAIRPQAPMQGPFRVEITAMGKTGKKTGRGAGARIDIEGQVLPSRYNADSKLQVEIKPAQRNEFPFSLKSK
jgi:hypothetical protein